MSKATGAVRRKRIGLSIDQAASLAAQMLGTRFSTEQVRGALVDGTLAGRNFGGSIGWVTTERAVDVWVRALLNEPPAGGAA